MGYLFCELRGVGVGDAFMRPLHGVRERLHDVPRGTFRTKQLSIAIVPRGTFQGGFYMAVIITAAFAALVLAFFARSAIRKTARRRNIVVNGVLIEAVVCDTVTKSLFSISLTVAFRRIGWTARFFGTWLTGWSIGRFLRTASITGGKSARKSTFIAV
jgi:hypothetical protein